jgi:hypothetical protein
MIPFDSKYSSMFEGRVPLFDEQKGKIIPQDTGE